jgi:hypothetical protein
MSTDLCVLAEKYGVDKCPKIGHTYTPVYDSLLTHGRASAKCVLEIGVGNIPLMAQFVGDSYKPGASLRMWRDYFPNAQIIGCDIVKSVLFNDEDRIHTFFCDQSLKSSLENLMRNVQSIAQYPDVIIDDGSHMELHQRISFRLLWDYVRPNGGIYIIEDISENFEGFKRLHLDMGFIDAELVYAHSGKNSWDRFVAFRKN